MIAFQNNDFIEIFPLAFGRGIVHILDWGKPMNDLEVRSWAGQFISLNGEMRIVKSARFYETPEGQPKRYLLGLLI